MASESVLVEPVLSWFEAKSRTLPWRAPDAGPWAVLVSEFMLQQTPVARVLPVYTEWLSRWPTPQALAAEPAGAAVRAWGRLGYPRRAIRLHAAATAIVEHHGGRLPTDIVELRALPGVGDYTAAAVATFAFRQRHAVLDTNVRRVLARALGGHETPAPAVTIMERQRAEAVLPEDPERAARFAVGLMEFGALVCRARHPACEICPVAEQCRWLADGRPAAAGPARPPQIYVGSDRQARGALLAVLRAAATSVSSTALATAWSDDVQRARALTALIQDGLVEAAPRGRFRLPGEANPT